MHKRILFTSNNRLTKVIKNNISSKLRNNLWIMNLDINQVLPEVRSLIRKNKIDVIIARSSHAKILKEHFKEEISIVEINISLFDILKLIQKSNYTAERIAIAKYKEYFCEFEMFSDMFKISPKQIIFNSIKDLKTKLRLLTDKDYKAVIGTSTVCDVAENFGLKPLFIYSNDSVLKAICQAKKIANARNIEKRRTEQLKTILDFTYSGIISYDKKGIIRIFNPIASKIIGIDSDDALGHSVNEVMRNSNFTNVLKSGDREINKLESYNDKKILISRIPIKVNGQIYGVVATFEDIENVKKNDLKIRRETHKKGLIAKYTFDDIVGESKEIEYAKNMACAYAHTDANILITGETGTGKELFAQSIHNYSLRNNGPFIAVNCASYPKSLLESELFGYEEGAFTGAKKGGKKGIFESAHKGTIFLDEIGKMPLFLQSRLLRVIEEKAIMRLGSNSIIPIDVRIIAASNENLLGKIREGEFQKDLYYRVNTLYFYLPPLRKRKEDIILLAKYFLLNKYKTDYNRNKNFWDKLINLMLEIDWPGNVRQLENVIQRLCVLLNNNLHHNHTPLNVMKRALDEDIKKNNKKEKNKREEIIDVLNKVGWNREKAAKKLKMSRTTLWRKMKEMNIEN